VRVLEGAMGYQETPLSWRSEVSRAASRVMMIVGQREKGMG